jgi:hypothetical protein
MHSFVQQRTGAQRTCHLAGTSYRSHLGDAVEMGSLVHDRENGKVQVAGSAQAEAIAAQVRTLLSGAYPEGRLVERRASPRYPYPRLVVLTPVRGESLAPVGPPLVAVGRQLSETGLGLFHPAPLPFRLVIASLEDSDGGWLGFLLDLTWCRFTRHGWYESGGRFLQVVASPLAADA